MVAKKSRYLLAACGGFLVAVPARAVEALGVDVVGEVPLRTGTGIPLFIQKVPLIFVLFFGLMFSATITTLFKETSLGIMENLFVG